MSTTADLVMGHRVRPETAPKDRSGGHRAPQMLDHAQHVPNSSVEPALAQVGTASWGVCKTAAHLVAGAGRWSGRACRAHRGVTRSTAA